MAGTGVRQTHRALAESLRTGPFDVALRTAIEARGLPLDRLRSRLAERGSSVGVTTLSYWQRGLRRPERPESLRAVTALEEILGLPAHSLTVLLGPPRPRGGAVRGAPRFSEIIQAPGELDALLAELDSPAAGKLRVVSQYDAVRVGPDRALESIDIVSVVAAREDGVDRALFIYTVADGEDVDEVRLVAGDSCRAGRTRAQPGARAVVAELLFDRCLRLGETHLITYRVLVGGPAECREHVTGFRMTAGHYVLRVGFHPDALPVGVHRFLARGSAAREEEHVELTLDSHRAVHLVADQFGPGAVGIRWDWW